jgi:hypothetical protein
LRTLPIPPGNFACAAGSPKDSTDQILFLANNQPLGQLKFHFDMKYIKNQAHALLIRERAVISGTLRKFLIQEPPVFQA